MLETLAATLPHLPDDQPRYLMGLGDPLGMVESVALGIDLFDCVLPTRFGRHGTILSTAGRYNLRSEEHTSELQSLMRISYAVFCLKKKNLYTHTRPPTT